MKKIMIYGAKSLALGLCKALQKLYPDKKIGGFLVSSLDDNPGILNELKVREIDEYAKSLSEEEKKQAEIWIGTPENIHHEISEMLKEYGFENIIGMDSHMESELMEKYFKTLGRFPSVHKLPVSGEVPKTEVYKIKCFKDVELSSDALQPGWVHDIQVGAALTDIRTAQILDNDGDNISTKNGNYCETTAFYWLWKNRLEQNRDDTEYYGFYHYRRALDIDADDLRRMKANDVDAVLQFPTLHEPDIREHHARYIREQDWQTMLGVLGDLYPEYWEAYDRIFSQEYFYNYNLIIAKPVILRDYCRWLFPLLEETEKRSIPKGTDRNDRYLAYMSESLMTFYFLYNDHRLKIYHSGRLMFT